MTHESRSRCGRRSPAARVLLCFALLAGCGGSQNPQSDPQGDSGLFADFAGTPLAGTVPLTVQFTDLSEGEITAHAWDFGDGSGSTEKDPAHAYTQPGLYTVGLFVRGPGGEESASRPDYVQVQIPAPAEVISAFGSDTPGGTGGQVLHVTTLAGSGPGSLREALAMRGPRIVVFDVAGVIDLELQTLRVEEPYLTLDAHSGPAPGSDVTTWSTPNRAASTTPSAKADRRQRGGSCPDQVAPRSTSTRMRTVDG